MFIKTIVVEGAEGDVEIARLDAGALVTSGDRVLCEVGRYEDREARYAKAYEVAKVVCGTDRRGRPNATNSMIHDVLNEIERVAGC
jgi:phosphoribosylamine-glycine ligase